MRISKLTTKYELNTIRQLAEQNYESMVTEIGELKKEIEELKAGMR